MECNTQSMVQSQDALARIERDWDQVAQEFGAEIETLARASKALVRARNLRKASDLLRLILVYAVCDWPLLLVCAWGVIQGIAELSDVALLYRFRQSPPFLGQLLAHVLQRRNVYLRQQTGVQVRLMDATMISRPGSTGSDWRVHLSMDLGQMCIDGVELTDAKGGESLARLPVRSDEIWIADRGYGLAIGLGPVLAQIGRLIVRITWQNLPLHDEQGRRINLIGWLERLHKTSERAALLHTAQGSFALRLIACPLPPAQAEKARERIRKQLAKKGKIMSHNTWLAAGFVMLVTNLPLETWPVERILWLYRMRWQVELQFKRMKSLLQLDHLRAQDPRLVQTYLLGKLLAALLLDQLVGRAVEQAPAGFQSLRRPLSLWRLQALLWQGIRALVVGQLSLWRILSVLPKLRRYLCDSPRKRCQQLAWARSILHRLSVAGV